VEGYSLRNQQTITSTPGFQADLFWWTRLCFVVTDDTTTPRTNHLSGERQRNAMFRYATGFKVDAGFVTLSVVCFEGLF
jgi:hypothetical protein